MDETQMETSSTYHLLPTEDVEYSQHKSRRYLITVEPVVFLLFLSQTLSSAILTNLYLVNTCEVTLGFNHSDCIQLGSKSVSNRIRDLESQVQPHAAYILMTKSLLEACLPALLSMFLGPWSDLHGRKPLLMWPLLGYSLSYWLYLGASLIPNLSPSYLLVASIPIALSGGFISVISGMYSYISDVSTVEKRSLRMGVLDASLFTGLLVGSAGCAYLYALAGNMGYVANFGVSGTCSLLGFIYCIAVLPESVSNTQTRQPCCCLGSGLFQWNFVKDMVQTCCKRRPNYGRAMIFMIIIALATCIVTLEGDAAVSFLFTRKKFGWSIQDFTTLSCINTLIVVAGMLLGTSILSTWLRVPDAPLAMLGYLSKIIASVLCAFSPTSWYLYLATGVGVLGCLVGPLSRSILTKIVPKEDIGKVFSLTSSLEALTPLASSTLYTTVYTSTLSSFPGAFYVLSASIFGLNFLLLLIVVIIEHSKRTSQCVEVNEIQAP